VNRYKKIELSNYLNYDIRLKNYHCFNYNLLYNRTLLDNIELQYHKINLLEYIKDEKDFLLKHEDRKEKTKNFEKKNNPLILKKDYLEHYYFYHYILVMLLVKILKFKKKVILLIHT